MKKSDILSLVMALSVMSITFSSCDKEKEIAIGDLPKEIAVYIATHFPDNPIISAKIDLEGTRKTYEIKLQGGFELEFNRKKEIIEIEGISKLPNSVIPQKILDYVNANYPDNFIVEWELGKNHQEVKLDNKLELIFDMKGNFFRINQ